MEPKPVPNPLADILHRHCNVNAYTANWSEALRKELFAPGKSEVEMAFRHQLRDAILYDTIGPKEYEQLTGEDFDTRQDLKKWLSLLWKEIYSNRPVSDD